MVSLLNIRQYKVYSITLLLLLILSTTFIHSSNYAESIYYWLEPGAYFKYVLYSSGGAIYFNDLTNEPFNYTQYKTSNLTISWKIIEVNGKYMTILYSISARNTKVTIYGENATFNEIRDLNLTRKYLVDIETLDTYIMNEQRKSGLVNGPSYYNQY
ncbi:MAG: hypothetical protein B6U89_00515 [Desulfurococcales archaeon ex4484_58]|nr:MAG: hypothetical protein B6U89_00515 [Desulfurococcales archaeon ex4484_58]